MELGKGINRQSGATSSQMLDPWVPVTPAKPEQPPRTVQSDWVQSATITPGGTIDSSGASYTFDATERNVGLMSFSNQVQNAIAGMGGGMPCLQLLQMTSAQAGSNLIPSFFPVLYHPQIDGFNQLMYMDNPGAVNTCMTGTNPPPYNHTLHLSALAPTEGYPIPFNLIFGSQNSCANSTAVVPTNSNNNAVSPLAPATPDKRFKQTQGRHPTETINSHMDAQWPPKEKDKDGQSRYSFEAQVANYQDQCNTHTQENEPTSCIRQENVPISLSSEQGITQLANKIGIITQPFMNASFEPVTPLKESHNHLSKEDCQGIDLNKTPQQKQKKKKHRPKVVREAKPKKPQKPITPEEPKREKRKYVRKSTAKKNATALSGGGIPSELTGNNEGAKASCRRALNFNLESNPGEGSTGGAGSCILAFESHSETQPKNTCESSNYNRDTSLQQGLQFNPILYVEQSDTGIGVDLNFSLTPNSLPTTVRKEPSKENMKFLARRKGVKQMPQCASNKVIGDTARSVPENAFQHVLGMQTNSDVLSTVLSLSGKGLKRGFCETTITAEVDRTNLLDVHDTGTKKSKTGVLQKDVNTYSTSSMTETGHTNCSSYPLCNNSEGKNKANDQSCDFSYNGHSHSLSSGYKHRSMDCDKGEASPEKVHKLQGMLTTTSEKVTMARPNESVDVWHLPLLTALTKDGQLPVSQGHEVGMDRTEGHYQKARKTKKHSTSLIESASSSIIYEAKSLENKSASSDQYQQLVEGRRSESFVSAISLVEFSQSKMLNMNSVHSVHHSEAANRVLSYRNLVDDIVHRLKYLNISGQNALSDENQNALVPYGGDGQMVTYEGPFDPIRRKQRPRAKVDLDSETLRVWDMLMWKEGSNTNEAADPEKEKWWEEERRVFKGRADSFIARMHLVQGDRRFSRWKGSVVDSVIGVFLTQNVSDVLSSSAFMALAARFPLQSRSSNNGFPSREEGISRSNSPKWQETSLTQGMSNENSVIIHEGPINNEKEMRSSIDCFGRCSADYSEGHPTALGEEEQIIGHNSSDENASNVVDEVIFSQNSVISNRSSTESCNQIISHVSSGIEVDEVENLVLRSKFKGMFDTANTPFIELLQMQGDGRRESHDEEACNSYEEWHKNELYQEVHVQSSTTLNQAQPIAYKDLMNTTDIFGGSMVNHLKCKLTSTGEKKNQIGQEVPERTTETSPVEDVISSQISVVSSVSSPESCMHTENSMSSVAKFHETGNVVTGFRCSSVFDRDKTSFTKLLQMQGDKMVQGLYRNNGNVTEPSNKFTERTTLDNKYLSSIEQGTRPLWGSSEKGWTNVSINESRSCLPSTASRIADIKDNHVINRCQSADPRSHFTALPISLSPFLSVDDSCAQPDRHAVQLSLGSEPKTLADLKQRQKSRREEVQSGLIRSHLEKAVEIEESFSYVNNMNSVERNVAESEHGILDQASSERHDSKRLKPQSGLVTQDIGEICDFIECSSSVNSAKAADSKIVISNSELQSSEKSSNESITIKAKSRIKKIRDDRKKDIDWDSLRKGVCCQGQEKPRSCESMDSLDYESLRCADVKEIADAIRERGMNNMLAQRIKDFLNRMVHEHGSIDLEWLRNVPPDKAKEYLLSIRGLGLKSVECVRLLTLHHLAFPVDTNVGRIAVRLGWVPIQPLPESLQLHLLEMYPILESVQKYLWPRLCKLDQKTLYELHYQLITFGKVFCTKSKPNCNACPMRGECKHFASAFASARLALPGPEDKSLVSASVPVTTSGQNDVMRKLMSLPSLEGPQFAPESRINTSEPIMEVSASVPLTTLGQNDTMKSFMPLPSLEGPHFTPESRINTSQPIIEEPTSPEPEKLDLSESAMEEAFWQDDIEDIPTIKLNLEELSQNVQIYMQENNMELQNVDMSKALVALTAEAASIPMPKLKNISRLRTEHQVYELPDGHTLLEGLEPREPDDPSPYLLAIWSPGETANSIQPPEMSCESQELGSLCDKETCFSCNSIKEANTQTVRGTLLIPCRTAMRGSFPLNGTYFQVNEVFADHDSSLEPINVPRGLIWNLRRRTVYFGTSVPTIFRGLTTEGIQHCFWRGFVCVRGFERKRRAPRPLMARLHLAASKLAKRNQDMKKSSEEQTKIKRPVDLSASNLAKRNQDMKKSSEEQAKIKRPVDRLP